MVRIIWQFLSKAFPVSPCCSFLLLFLQNYCISWNAWTWRGHTHLQKLSSTLTQFQPKLEPYASRTIPDDATRHLAFSVDFAFPSLLPVSTGAGAVVCIRCARCRFCECMGRIAIMQNGGFCTARSDPDHFLQSIGMQFIRYQFTRRSAWGLYLVE